MEIQSCRICLLSADTLISLYEMEKDELIVDLLSFCMGVPIISDDKFPKYICDECLELLKNAHELKIKFFKNDDYLKNVLVQSAVNFKQDDYDEEEDYSMEYEPAEEGNVIEEETFEIVQFEEDTIELEASSLVSYDTEYLDEYLEESIEASPKPKPEEHCKTPKRIQLESKLCSKSKIKKIELAKPKIIIRKSVGDLNTSENSSSDKQKKLSCKLCGLVLSRKENLDNHMVVIHKEAAKFCCHICDKGFGASYELKRHLQRIHNAVPLPSSKLIPPKERKIYQKPHVELSLIGDPLSIPKSNVICYICDAAFDQLREKILHIEEQHIHETNCSICDYTCTGGMALNSHMKKHKVERSIFCKLCNKGFYEMKHLRDHLKFVHPDPAAAISKIECNLCESTFQTVSGLRKHHRKFPDCTKMTRKGNKRKVSS